MKAKTNVESKEAVMNGGISLKDMAIADMLSYYEAATILFEENVNGATVYEHDEWNRPKYQEYCERRDMYGGVMSRIREEMSKRILKIE